MKFLLALAAFLLTSLAAQADCTSPAGVAGKIFFNTAYKVLEYCDGTTWYNLGTPNAAGALGNCTNPAGPPGKLIYNTAHNVLQYCNGTGWINLGAAQDNAPVNCTNPVSKPGQIFFNASSKTLQYCNGATWVNTGRWDVDSDPDPFNFTNLTGQNLSTQVSSDIIQITGLGGLTTIAVSGTGSPQIRVCNNSDCSSVQTTWGTSMNIANGKYIQARQTTSASNSTAQTATVTIGTLGNSIWSVTTLDDTTPDSYSFTNLTDQSKSAQVNSNIIQITGINVSVTTTTSGASSEIRTCSNSDCSSVQTTWGTSMQIANNQYLQARQTTSGSAATSTSATVVVGTGTTTWSATTINVVPGSQNYSTAGTYTFNVPAYNTITFDLKGGGGGGGGHISYSPKATAGGATSVASLSLYGNGGGPGADYNGSNGANGTPGTASGGTTNTTGGGSPGGAGGNTGYVYGGTGGAGGRTQITYTAGAPGAPTAGDSLSVVVGAGGGKGNYNAVVVMPGTAGVAAIIWN